VCHRTGGELGDPRVDRVICVEFLHRDGQSIDGSPPLEELVPGRGPFTEAGQRILGEWPDALDPDEREQRELVRGLGRYYGYPECCIEAFPRARFVELRTDGPTHPPRGYVICDACAADPERADRLAAESRAERIAPPDG
jgi:hypothetical protein